MQFKSIRFKSIIIFEKEYHMQKCITALVCLLFLSCLLSGCQYLSKDAETTAVEGHTVEHNASGEYVDMEDPYEDVNQIPTAEERNAQALWNIELQYDSYNEDGIYITIYDYDNLGFIHDMRYVLEKKEGDEWVRIMYMKDTLGPRYVVPQTVKDYICLPFLCMKPRDVGYEPGHYRITKTISERDFTVEFDLE